MRVVAGTARGRRLGAPPGRDTRPTSDRVREAVFNALGSMDVIREATVLDLFAGSGALGIEALSRGAAHSTFVERDGAALDAVRSNLETTGLGGRATIRRADAMTYLDGDPSVVDVAFLDPPYAFDRWEELLERLPAGVAVVESDRVIDPGEAWEVARQKWYGGTVVAIIRRRSRPDPEESSA